MKKLLTILGAIVITGSATATVVACGPKEEKNVKFIIPGNTSILKTSKTYKAYQELIDNFNKTSGSKIKIDLQWKEGDPIGKAVASGEALPDLYIDSPDAVASNSLGRTKDKVRDMEQSVGKLENGKQLKDLFVKEAFYEEGKINGKLALLPLTKSIDFTAVNMKLFVELIMILERSEGTTPKTDKKLSDKLITAIDDFNNADGRKLLLQNMQYKVNQTATNHIVTMKERFESPNMKTRSIEETNGKSGYIFKKDAKVTSDLRTEFSNILTALNTNPSVDGIRSVMQKQENVELFTKLYSYLFNLEGDAVSPDVATNNGAAFVRNQMFSVGVDSMENKIFMQAALDSKNDTIDASNNPPSNFIYKLENFNPSTREGKFTINNSEDSSISKILNSFDKLASFAKNRKDNDPNNKWGGSFMPGKMGQTYSSSYFAQGTMLATSSSSSGTWAIPSKNALPQDLISTSTALVDNKDGEDYFLLRGPSVAGFKSSGKNAAEKEALVTKFLNYSLQPKVQTKFALQNAYMPSTKVAVDRFSNYVNGNYNSLENKWMIEESKRPTDHKDYEQILEAVTGKNNPKTDILMADLLSKYISTNDASENQKSTKTHLVSNVTNPFGQLMKNAISDSIKTYVVKSDDPNKKFISVLKDDKTSSETIIGQLKQNITGDLAKVELVMGPLNKAIDHKRIKQD